MNWACNFSQFTNLFPLTSGLQYFHLHLRFMYSGADHISLNKNDGYHPMVKHWELLVKILVVFLYGRISTPLQVGWKRDVNYSHTYSNRREAPRSGIMLILLG